MPAIGTSDMPPASADLATAWPFLEEGIEDVMARPHTGITLLKFMNLYSVIYNYCHSSLFNGTFEERALGSEACTNRLGLDLYNNLTRYFTAHLEERRKNFESIVDQDLLRSYAGEWDRFTTSIKYINRLFAYFDRHWVQREREEGKRNVYKVYILALVQWRDKLFYPIQNKNRKLVVALLKMIEKQRNGEIIDSGILNKVIGSFVTLGLDGFDRDTVQLGIYQKEFENPFIEATEKYYSHVSATLFQEHSVLECLKKAEERLREEEDQVERYLHFSTRKTLVGKCEEVLFERHSRRVQDYFQNGLDYNNVENVQGMYCFLAHTTKELEPLKKGFEEHVRKAGLAAIAKLQGEAAGSTGGQVEPKAYFNALFEVYRKNRDTVNRSFRSEADFVASLDRACCDFVNRNDATGASLTKSPELLSKYADTLLRKNNKVSEESNLEDFLNEVISLFKYIEDKDVFQTFYATQLSKRLIYGLSASDESEASMIAKLKEACGFEYTKKLQCMFADMQLSKDLTDRFKEHMNVSCDTADLDITFSAMVLGTNSWPLNAPAHNFTIPKNILPTYELFQRYYQSQHSGRKLTWLWNHSKNELRTNYLNRKYIFMTSSYQMAILVQYNENDTLSLEDLITATGIPRELLSQALGALVKAEILINEETEQYDLNPNFKSKRIRVDLDQPTKAEVKQESAEVLKTVDKTRKYVIQAIIVRIMKARKTMNYQMLIQEVTSQISTRFAPRIPDIKKAIETLLEKEYIERADGQRDVFNYVP